MDEDKGKDSVTGMALEERALRLQVFLSNTYYWRINRSALFDIFQSVLEDKFTDQRKGNEEIINFLLQDVNAERLNAIWPWLRLPKATEKRLMDKHKANLKLSLHNYD